MSKIKGVLNILIFFILLYTRFVNLSWGLPYPFHPDERNMAVALQSLKCEFTNFPTSLKLRGIKIIQNCFNPNFFAYGQFTLYLGYAGIQAYHVLTNKITKSVSYDEAVIALRTISAIASVINVFILIKIVELIVIKSQIFPLRQGYEGQANLKKIPNLKFISFIIFTFSPFFIQFAHFGTTESLLMLFYSLIIFLSLKNIVVVGRAQPRRLNWLAVICGLAVATKVSSLIFIAVPVASILFSNSKKTLNLLLKIINFLALTLIFAVVFSPHNLLSIEQFLGALRYESDVALGRYVVFYTRQFVGAIPVIFQFLKTFPYALGWPALILFISGFVFLPWKKEINILRFAFLIYFIPNAFLFAKWTRFMAPILPLMLIFGALLLNKVYSSVIPNEVKDLSRMRERQSETSSEILQSLRSFRMTGILFIYFLIFLSILPGLAYLSIYQNPDIRFTSSEWIYKNIQDNSYILSETANVVDIPIKSQITNFQLPISNYKIISFNFYDLDTNLQLQEDLKMHLQKADYIFIPSRRIFANNYCSPLLSFRRSAATEKSIFSFLQISRFARNDIIERRCLNLKKTYPLLHNYYEKLFSGKLGFKKVADFTSYPKIEFFGKTLIEFPDEDAEETWSVFDHPVVRVYKRV